MSAEIMKLHHSKHHQAYVTNLNVAEEQFLEATAKGNVAAAQAVIPSLRCEQQWRVGWVAFLPLVGLTPASVHQLQRRRPHQPHHLLDEPRAPEPGRRRAAVGRPPRGDQQDLWLGPEVPGAGSCGREGGVLTTQTARRLTYFVCVTIPGVFFFFTSTGDVFGPHGCRPGLGLGLARAWFYFILFNLLLLCSPINQPTNQRLRCAGLQQGGEAHRDCDVPQPGPASRSVSDSVCCQLFFVAVF